MTLSIIVAVDESGVIGKENGIPWYLPADLAHFKKTTTGHPIIMGRKTHESIGRILPERLNIIVSRNPSYRVEGASIVSSLDQAMEMAKASDDTEAFIIGGESIYQTALPLVDKLYVTRVHAKIDGDKYFKYSLEDWKVVSKASHQPDEKNKYSYDFLVMERTNVS